MRKFFYLDRKRKWQGPYLLIQIIGLCLSGKIHPSTYLWKRTSDRDDASTPWESASPRKPAHEFKYFPLWLFGGVLKAYWQMYRMRAARKIMLIFSKKKKEETALLTNPVEQSNILESASVCYILNSITSILDFPGDTIYQVKVHYKDIHTNEPTTGVFPIQLTADDSPGVKFSIKMDPPPEVAGVLHHQSYGLHRRLLLEAEHENVLIGANAIFDFSTRFPSIPQILRGRFRELSVPEGADGVNRYHRLVMEIPPTINPITPGVLERTGTHLYDHEPFNVHDSLMGIQFRTGGGYTLTTVGGNPYRIFAAGSKRIVIEGLKPQSLSTFKKESATIRITLALLSGNYLGGTCYYLSTSTPDFKDTEHMLYKIERPSVFSDRSALDLTLFRGVIDPHSPEYAAKYHAFDRPLDNNIFAVLCKKLLDSHSLAHAAELLISGMGNHDPLQQGALYSVAIEAITEELGNVKNKGLKPVSDPAVWAKLLDEWKKTVEKHKDDLNEDAVRILTKKLDNLNSPPNRDRLIQTFGLYGLSLDQRDTDAINNRNEFLHGRNPLVQNPTLDLESISLRLHSLIVALILKYVGYSGHIINLDIKRMFSDEDNTSAMANRIFKDFQHLRTQREDAFRNNDDAAVRQADERIRQFAHDNQMPEIFRII